MWGAASRFLDSLALARLNSMIIGQVRSVASSILDHAACKEVIAVSPFQGARMQESAKKPQPTRKYTVEEIAQIVRILRGDFAGTSGRVGLLLRAPTRRSSGKATRLMASFFAENETGAP